MPRHTARKFGVQEAASKNPGGIAVVARNRAHRAAHPTCAMGANLALE